MDFSVNMMESGRGGLSGQVATSMGISYAPHITSTQVQQQSLSNGAISAHQLVSASHQHAQQQAAVATAAQVQRLTLQQQQQVAQQQAAQQVAAQQQAAAAVAAAQAQAQQQQQHHHHHTSESSALSHATEIKVQELSKEEPQSAAFTPPPRVESVGNGTDIRLEKGTDTTDMDPIIKVEIKGYLPGITPNISEKDKSSIVQMQFNSVHELLQYFSRGAISQQIDALNFLSPEIVRNLNPDLVRNHFLYVPSSQESVRVSSNGFSSSSSSPNGTQALGSSPTSSGASATVAGNTIQLPIGGGKIMVKQERKRGELPPGTIIHRPPPIDPNAANVFVCWICGLDLQKSLQFEEHMVDQHSIDKPYRCEDCGVTFKRKAHLDRHRRIHLPTRPYQCGVCGKGFTRNEHVRRHSFTHTGEKPYFCRICKKNYIKVGCLQKHIYQIHPNLPISECFGEVDLGDVLPTKCKYKNSSTAINRSQLSESSAVDASCSSSQERSDVSASFFNDSNFQERLALLGTSALASQVQDQTQNSALQTHNLDQGNENLSSNHDEGRGISDQSEVTAPHSPASTESSAPLCSPAENNDKEKFMASDSIKYVNDIIKYHSGSVDSSTVLQPPKTPNSPTPDTDSKRPSPLAHDTAIQLSECKSTLDSPTLTCRAEEQQESLVLHNINNEVVQNTNFVSSRASTGKEELPVDSFGTAEEVQPDTNLISQKASPTTKKQVVAIEEYAVVPSSIGDEVQKHNEVVSHRNACETEEPSLVFYNITSEDTEKTEAVPFIVASHLDEKRTFSVHCEVKEDDLTLTPRSTANESRTHDTCIDVKPTEVSFQLVSVPDDSSDHEGKNSSPGSTQASYNDENNSILASNAEVSQAIHMGEIKNSFMESYDSVQVPQSSAKFLPTGEETFNSYEFVDILPNVENAPVVTKSFAGDDESNTNSSEINFSAATTKLEDNASEEQVNFSQTQFLAVPENVPEEVWNAHIGNVYRFVQLNPESLEQADNPLDIQGSVNENFNDETFSQNQNSPMEDIDEVRDVTVVNTNKDETHKLSQPASIENSAEEVTSLPSYDVEMYDASGQLKSTVETISDSDDSEVQEVYGDTSDVQICHVVHKATDSGAHVSSFGNVELELSNQFLLEQLQQQELSLQAIREVEKQEQQLRLLQSAEEVLRQTFLLRSKSDFQNQGNVMITRCL